MLRDTTFSTERLKECVNNIIVALQRDNSNDIVQTCFELGFFLQSNFYGKGLDDLQKFLRDFKDCESFPLPPLTSFTKITEGKILAYQEMVTNEENNKEKIITMDSLSKGIAMFGTLMGGDRFRAKLEELPYPTDQEIDETKEIISTQVGQIAESVQSINIIETECESYKKHLENIVAADISKRPDAYSKYELFDWVFHSNLNADFTFI